MKRLGNVTPWWVGEKFDCQQCGASWELEEQDAKTLDTPFDPALDPNYDGTKVPMLVSLEENPQGIFARLVCRDCGWDTLMARSGITVPRRLGIGAPDQAMLAEAEVDKLDAYRKSYKKEVE